MHWNIHYHQVKVCFQTLTNPLPKWPHLLPLMRRYPPFPTKIKIPAMVAKETPMKASGAENRICTGDTKFHCTCVSIAMCSTTIDRHPTSLAASTLYFTSTTKRWTFSPTVSWILIHLAYPQLRPIVIIIFNQILSVLLPLSAKQIFGVEKY